MDQPGNHILLNGNQPGATDRMRELLARTVQDHLTDQRSNAGALEDIRHRMEGLEGLVKEVREREVPGMTARLDSLAQHLDEAISKPPQWAESLAEHIADYQRRHGEDWHRRFWSRALRLASVRYHHPDAYGLSPCETDPDRLAQHAAPQGEPRAA